MAMGSTHIAVTEFLIAALMAACPPWRVAVPTDYGGADVSIGYALVVSPPHPLATVYLGRLIAQ